MKRLGNIQNWPELGKQSGWCVAALAKKCGVSMRTLQRFFWENMGKPPKIWLVEQRQQQAIELVRKNNASVKEVAAQLGYKHAHHFSQEFKKHWGVYPTKINRSSP